MQLSIIVPMYNANEYIVKLLDSIYKQNQHMINFEVIIIDDVSTDNSYDLTRQYIDVNRLSNIKLVSSPQNGGTANARNIGIELAIGKWVQFLDSDDKLPSNYFEKIAEALEFDDIDCFIYGTESKYSDKIITHTPEGIIDQRMIGYKNSVCNKVFKRDLIENFNPDFKFEDVIWLVSLMNKNTYKCSLVPDLYYQINRKNENSKMANLDQDEWYKMALEIVGNSKNYNKWTRCFVLETFVGTMFAKEIKLEYRLSIAMKALRLNIRYLPFVVKHGIRKNDKVIRKIT